MLFDVVRADGLARIRSTSPDIHNPTCTRRGPNKKGLLFVACCKMAFVLTIFALLSRLEAGLILQIFTKTK